MTGSQSNTALDREIGSLPELPRADLVARWQALYRTDPPKGISRRLLIWAVAYAMQAKAHGGLKSSVKRRLKGHAGTETSDNPVASPHSALRPGTRLVREWNGSTHVVDVIESGYVWNGEHYQSLSAIARTITGARWSGPRFFGLKSNGAS